MHAPLRPQLKGIIAVTMLATSLFTVRVQAQRESGSHCPAPTGEPVSPIAYVPDDDLVHLFAPQIEAHLVAGGIDSLATALAAAEGPAATLEPGQLVGGQAIAADITGDGQVEIVVGLSVYYGGTFGGSVFVYGCPDGAYQRLAQVAMGGWSLAPEQPGNPHIVAVADLTGDGAAEIVLDSLPMVGRGYIRALEVYTWHVGGLVDLTPRNDYAESLLGVWNGAGSVEDFNGDAQPDLVLTGPHVNRRGLTLTYRTLQDVWTWDGAKFSLTCSRVIGRPEFRFEALENGDGALACGRYSEALAYYRRVLFDESLLPWRLDCGDNTCMIDPAYPLVPGEYERLAAFARYRSLLAFLALEQGDSAAREYARLVAENPIGTAGEPFASLGTAFWSAYNATGSLIEGCTAAIAYAQAHSTALFVTPDVYFRGEMAHGYFDAFLADPARICPW